MDRSNLVAALLFFVLFSIYGVTNKSEAQVLQGDSWSDTQADGTGEIKVAFYEEAAFAFYDDQGNPSGVSIDILKQFINYIQNTHNIELDISYISYDSWSQFYNDITESSGGVFGLGNVTITEERKQVLNFSPSYLTNIAVLITHESVEDLSSFDEISDEFRNKTAVSYTGTTHEGRINKLVEQGWDDLDIESAATDGEVVDFVSNNPQSFGYIDLYNYWLAAEEHNRPVKRHAVGDQASEDFGFIMPLDSDWDDELDNFFHIGSGFRATNLYRDILQEYLGREVSRLLQMARQ